MRPPGAGYCHEYACTAVTTVTKIVAITVVIGYCTANPTVIVDERHGVWHNMGSGG